MGLSVGELIGEVLLTACKVTGIILDVDKLGSWEEGAPVEGEDGGELVVVVESLRGRPLFRFGD